MKKAKEIAVNLAAMGLPVEQIAAAVKISIQSVQKWLAGNVAET